jgi:hypothetical protein
MNYYTCYTLFDLHHKRNWDTMLQVISMRTQPTIIGDIEGMLTDQHEFGAAHDGQHKLWRFRFSVEVKDVFSSTDSHTALLEMDSELVPLTTGESETAALDPACIITGGTAKNTYFISESAR